MNNINKYRFSDLYDISSGISSSKEQAGHGAPFVSFSTVFNNIFLPDELPDKMDTSISEQEACSIKEGDILLTRTSETIDELAMSCVAAKDYPNATFSGFVKRLRPKTDGIAYHKYLAFYLRGYLFRQTVTNNAFMTLRASFNEDIFSYLYLYLPPFKQQVLIGDLFYRIEQKIRLNSRICAELEAMAKTLYDYWFVQFDFLDENGKPYRTSGGAMEWCQELGREVPKGWKIDTIDHIISIVRGVSYQPSDELSSLDEDSIKLLKSNNIQDGSINFDSPVYLPSEKANNEQWLTKGSVFITMSSGSKLHMGKTAIVFDDLPYVFGAFCAKIKIESLYQYWLAVYFRHELFRTHIENVTLGTSINNINAHHITSIKLAFPPKEVLERFNAVLSPCFDMQGKIMKENTQLQSMRDWLLPMLMNGQAKMKHD